MLYTLLHILLLLNPVRRHLAALGLCWQRAMT